MSKGTKIIIGVLVILIVIVGGFTILTNFFPEIEQKVLNLIAGTEEPEEPAPPAINPDDENQQDGDGGGGDEEDAEEQTDNYEQVDGDILFKKDKSNNKYSAEAGSYTFEGQAVIDEFTRTVSLPVYGLKLSEGYNPIHLTRKDYFSTNIADKEQYNFIANDGVGKSSDDNNEYKYFKERNESFTKEYIVTFSKEHTAIQPGSDNDYYVLGNYFQDNTGKSKEDIRNEFRDYLEFQTDIFENAYYIKGNTETDGYSYKYVGINPMKPENTIKYYDLSNLEEGYFEELSSLEKPFTHSYFTLTATNITEEEFASLLNAMTIN